MPWAPKLYSPGQGYDAPIRQGGSDQGRAGKPGQAFIANGNSAVAPPAVLLETQRRSTVGPGQQQADDSGHKNPGAKRRGYQC